MPSTQAYSVSWDVRIQPEGDVSQDVTEIHITEEKGSTESASVTLDTSARPHALEEQESITIVISDENTFKRFEGIVDAVRDADDRPVVTVDARESDGLLHDVTAVGSVSADNLLGVIDGIVDGSAGQVREISYDPSIFESLVESLSNSADYAGFRISHSGDYSGLDTLNSHEQTLQGQETQVEFDSYSNTTGNTYVCNITGEDGSGNPVTATFDLPPGSDPNDAYGTFSFKLAPSGGSGRFAAVTGISTDVPNLSTSGDEVVVRGNITDYLKTDWDFKVSDQTSVHDAISRVVQYISAKDSLHDWDFFVDSDDKLRVGPDREFFSQRFEFREGDNVIKPVASRDLDGVRNMVKVSGSGGVNAWHWAYDGVLYQDVENPFENGAYPDSGSQWDTGYAEQNHIDEINIRAVPLAGQNITSLIQAIDIGQDALKQYLRPPVTGQAPVTGVHPASPRDEAEVYYPSRGIPAKVEDNVYEIKKVEYRITPESAKTTIDFGRSKPNLADVIGSGGIERTDISDNITQYEPRSTTDSESGAVGRSVVVGTLDQQNADGTWTVTGEDGETYDNVRII